MNTPVTRPNILWISTHDINPHLGAYAGVWPGAGQAHTPNLDRLAREGMRFDHAYAAAPVCAPSRSAVITGCYPTSIGTMHMRSNAVLPEEVRMLPEILRDEGYYTTNNWFRDFQTEMPGTAYDDASATSHWRDRPAGTPFFAAFHGMTTHESQIYLDDDSFAEATATVDDRDRHHPDSVEVPPYHPSTPVFRQGWARYLDLITAMDQWVGDLLQQLEDDGLTESTIVVFWSDHGAGFPRAKRWAGEAGLRVPLIVRWPGRITQGSSTTAPVGLVDLAPSMLRMCGVTPPSFMQGDAVLDADGRARVTRQYVYGGRDRMDEQEDTVRTVRDERFRYIRNYHPDRSSMQHCRYPDALPTWAELRRLAFEEATRIGAGLPRDLLTPSQRAIVAASKPAEQLFDITNDPHELEDLTHDPVFESDLIRLRNVLDEWITESRDLGMRDETVLVDEWRPGGEQQQVTTPQLEADGRIVCSTAGARVGWTTDPPTEHEPSAQELLMGFGATNDRRWNTLGTLPTEGRVWVKGWRPGYRSSEELRLDHDERVPR